MMDLLGSHLRILSYLDSTGGTCMPKNFPRHFLQPSMRAPPLIHRAAGWQCREVEPTSVSCPVPSTPTPLRMGPMCAFSLAACACSQPSSPASLATTARAQRRRQPYHHHNLQCCHRRSCPLSLQSLTQTHHPRCRPPCRRPRRHHQSPCHPHLHRLLNHCHHLRVQRRRKRRRRSCPLSLQPLTHHRQRHRHQLRFPRCRPHHHHHA